MPRRTTIKHVAEKAGTSISTVSLVLNGREHVSSQTRDRILRAVRDLGYHPYRPARVLASRTSGNLGFILTEDHFSHAEPFYTKVFLGSEFEARDHQHYLLLTTVEKRFTAKSSTPRFLLEKNVDGVVLAGKVSEKLVDIIESLGIPIVLVDYRIDRRPLSSVLIDNVGGVRIATRHLHRGGHVDIAFVAGDIRHVSMGERFRGYRETLAELGVPEKPSLIVVNEENTLVANGYQAIESIFARGGRPTAVVAGNDAMAFGCLQYAKRNRIRIPQDMAIVGFDDIEACMHMEPRLTTVSVAKEELGKLAVRHLVEAVRSKARSVVTTQMPVKLVVRESTGIAPLAPHEVHDAPAIYGLGLVEGNTRRTNDVPEG